MSNVLVIGDIHIPFNHRKYLSFCKKVQEDFACNTVVQIGDMVDNHAISYHDHNPDGFSSGDEYKRAMNELAKWYKAFPVVKVTVGNHDLLPQRKAVTHGLASVYMRNLSELWQSPPGWVWDTRFEIDNVIYTHGSGMSGKCAHINRAKENMQSTVIGHIHTHAGVGYIASDSKLIFGMNVGCGISISSYTFAYQKDFAIRPILGCGVVLNNGASAQFVPMKLT